MLYHDFVDPDDPDAGTDARLLIIDHDSYNINLRTLHDSFYVPAESGDEVLCTIETGVKVGSTSIAVPAFDVGDWPSGVDITIRVQGRIQGKGGKGGNGGFTTAENGFAGGPALYTRYAVSIDNQSQIYGGGGGGAGSVGAHGGRGGGGGAGFDPGAGGFAGGNTGTTEAGGSSGGGGAFDGGGPGAVGGGGAFGGAAGSAIDGVSFVTFDTTGSVLGPQVN
jgi:hypothetical protein